MDIRQIARPFEWEGATLWFLPYRALPVDIARMGLNDIEPEWEYVNTKTGERVVGDEPEALAKARAKANKMGYALKSDWQQNRLWNVTHECFWLYLPAVVSVDFPEFDESTPAAMRVFAAYWNDAGKTIRERWAAFSSFIPTEVVNALIEGWNETRDNPLPGKPELAQVESKDPLSETSSAEPEATTSDS